MHEYQHSWRYGKSNSLFQKQSVDSFLPLTFYHIPTHILWSLLHGDVMHLMLLLLVLQLKRKEWRIFSLLFWVLMWNPAVVSSTSGATRKTASEREAASLMPLSTMHVERERERSVWSLSAFHSLQLLLDGLCLVFSSLFSETYIHEALPNMVKKEVNFWLQFHIIVIFLPVFSSPLHFLVEYNRI